MADADDDYEPYDHRDKPVESLANSWHTLMHFLKASIGTGILAMHSAFSNTGTVVGILSTILLTAISGYCMQLLIRAQYMLCKKKRVGLMTYSEAMEYALETGPEKLRKLSRAGYYVIDLLIMIDQFGTCSVYVIFIGANMRQFIQYYANIHWSVRIYCLLAFVPIVAFTMLRNYRVMAPFSTMANISTFVGLGFIFSFVFQDLPAFTDRPMILPIARYPMYVGAILFAITSIGMITSLENNMTKPAEYIKPFGVLNIGYFVIMVLYMSVGLFGYIKYGYKEKLEGSITLDLPMDSLLAQSVKLIFSLATIISFAIQNLVTCEIIVDRYMRNTLDNSKHPVILEYIIRVSASLFTLILAITVPMLAEVINLMGAFHLSALAFLFPPLLDMLARYPDKFGKWNWIVVKNAFIIVFAAVSVVVGTYACIVDLAVEFEKQDI